jgi:hypothetical protein
VYIMGFIPMLQFCFSFLLYGMSCILHNTTLFLSYLLSSASLSSSSSCQAYPSQSSWCQAPIPATSLLAVAKSQVPCYALSMRHVVILSSPPWPPSLCLPPTMSSLDSASIPCQPITDQAVMRKADMQTREDGA